MEEQPYYGLGKESAKGTAVPPYGEMCERLGMHPRILSIPCDTIDIEALVAEEVARQLREPMEVPPARKPSRAEEKLDLSGMRVLAEDISMLVGRVLKGTLSEDEHVDALCEIHHLQHILADCEMFVLLALGEKDDK